MRLDYEHYEHECEVLHMQIDLQQTLHITGEKKHCLPKSMDSKLNKIETSLLQSETETNVTEVNKVQASSMD